MKESFSRIAAKGGVGQGALRQVEADLDHAEEDADLDHAEEDIEKAKIKITATRPRVSRRARAGVS